jgi:hypothetical protein
MRITDILNEAANPAQQAAIAIAKKKKQGIDEAVDFSKYPIKVYQNKQTGKFIAWVDLPNGKGDTIFPRISADTKEEAEAKQKEQIQNVLDNRSAGAKNVNAFLSYTNNPFARGILGKRDNERTYIKVENGVLYISTKPLSGFKPSGLTEKQQIWVTLNRKDLEKGNLEPGTRYRPKEISTNDPEVRAFELTEYNKILHSGDKSNDNDGPLFIVQYSGRNQTSEDIDEGETWSKHNNKRVGGMSKKSVSSYRRSHPGSKIQTAVTTKPSKLKKGSKAAKRRKSFCARMKGMKKSRTSAKTARDPNSNINKSLRRWNCESIEQMEELVMLAEQYIRNLKK